MGPRQGRNVASHKWLNIAHRSWRAKVRRARSLQVSIQMSPFGSSVIPRPRVRLQRRRTDSSRRLVVAVPPYEIHALQAGSGPEQLVLLHGLSGSSRWWVRNLSALSQQRRVLVPDVIGFGRTRCPGPIPSIERLAAIFDEWLDRSGVECTDLVGHSMGGQIAVHIAARFPHRVRRLVLVDSAGLFPALPARTAARFAAEVLPPARWGDPTFLPTIVRDGLRAGPRSIIRSIAHIVADNVGPLLSEIAAPTLVLWGAGDTIIPVAHAEEFRARIPNAEMLVLPEAAHNPMVDQPAEFNRIVARFLNGEHVGT